MPTTGVVFMAHLHLLVGGSYLALAAAGFLQWRSWD
jgi:hypothetical protein